MSTSDESLKNSTTLRTWDSNFPSFTYKDKPDTIYSRSLKPFAMLIVSSRNQGKSVMLRHLYETRFKNRFDIVIVFSNTLGTGWYDEFIPGSTKFGQFNENVLLNLFEMQEEHRREHGRYVNTLVIFDDCISEEIKHNEALQNIFTLGRHLAISICFITQSPTLAKTTWRQNITHLIVLRLKGKGKEHIINGFLLDLVDDDDTDINPAKFCQKLLKDVFDERYRALVVDYDNEGNGIRDCLFTFKVKKD